MDASNGQTDLVRKQSHRVVGRRGRVSFSRALGFSHLIKDNRWRASPEPRFHQRLQRCRTPSNTRVRHRFKGKRQAEVAEEASNRRTAVRSKWEEKSTGANRGVQSRLTVEKSGARVTRYPFKKRKKHHASQIRCTERRFHALIICFDRRYGNRFRAPETHNFE